MKTVTLAASLPDLAQELQRLLMAQNEPALAAQVPDLRIVDRCPCHDDFCAKFYVQPKPEGAYGPGHFSVDLDPKKGWIVMDVGDDRIVAVEVLYRDEIREKIHVLFP